MGGGQIQISHNINSGIVTGNGDATSYLVNNTSVTQQKGKKTKSLQPSYAISGETTNKASQDNVAGL